ncbi:MAG: zinc-dependent metalloprotease family protein, partial [Planctomycetota bacterium]
MKLNQRTRRPFFSSPSFSPLTRRLSRTRHLGLESLEARRNMALTVPAFSSLPGANHTIYLDFDGHVTTGTSWNSSYGVTSINSPAYSTDTDTANFSSSELATIERVYRRVAEDFAPFQVNVTTVEPVVDDLLKSGSTDTRWGVRAVITKDVAFNCGCGGIAYIDSFNWSSDTPVFVFNTGEVGVAEAASHEVGHSLGLSHDGTATAGYYQGHGTGATSWAPIMGVGYYVNVSQWDKGEYFGSNNNGAGANYNKGPDDLAIITSYNGFSYKADAVGNSLATAAPLSVSGTTVSASGVIEQRGDVDFYSFTTGAGAVTINLNPATLGANLDIKADLYDSTGTLVATSNPVDALNASFNLTLAEGTYYLSVDGVGVGDPALNPPTGYTDYASIGQYSISGSVVASNLSTL